MRAARAGSVWVREARPSRRRAASCGEMAKTPWQHCVQPARQTRGEPLRRVAEARAAVTIWMRSDVAFADLALGGAHARGEAAFERVYARRRRMSFRVSSIWATSSSFVELTSSLGQ